MKVKLADAPMQNQATLPRHMLDPWKVSPDDFPSDMTATGEDKLWFALNYAVLAPSSHNSQPWRFRIHGLEVDLEADRSRALPVVDPEHRELTISCGAALYHLRLALAYFGYTPRVEILPESDNPDLLARVHMGQKAETESDTILLFDAISNRRTNRQSFQDTPVPTTLLAALSEAAQAEGAWLHIVEDAAGRSATADLVAEADRQQWSDKRFRHELAAWVRPENSGRRDGLSVTTQDLGSVLSHAGPLAIRTFDLGKGRAAKDHEIAQFSPVLVVLGTERDDPWAWLAAGQALAQILLRAQAENVSASFLNQPIEVPQLRQSLVEAIGRAGFPQLLLRMGYGTAVKPSPRRPVSSVLVARAGHSAEVGQIR